ncbi:hypothetical protein EXIGLDRAFT_523762 [Exidia glandulosa HHB12029]|uniref:Uncharacterized protein n=1 Tax=Exidia glandulosa HHB12029 TaxID=1314781 RepID=A0A166MYY2_EXIGL|nr:hypothetical protein EXIGLDRAFT_523762 [Exidia glandulosa HHB12029]
MRKLPGAHTPSQWCTRRGSGFVWLCFGAASLCVLTTGRICAYWYRMDKRPQPGLPPRRTRHHSLGINSYIFGQWFPHRAKRPTTQQRQTRPLPLRVRDPLGRSMPGAYTPSH